jgi:hypothetical protein
VSEKEVFWKMVRAESREYLNSSLAYLRVLGVAKSVAWMKIVGLQITAYLYNPEDGEPLTEFFGGGEVIEEDHWRDGKTFYWKHDITPV